MPGPHTHLETRRGDTGVTRLGADISLSRSAVRHPETTLIYVSKGRLALRIPTEAIHAIARNALDCHQLWCSHCFFRRFFPNSLGGL